MQQVYKRYEIREAEFPHSGIICGGSEFVEKTIPETDPRYQRFYELLDFMEPMSGTEFEITVPDFRAITNVAIKRNLKINDDGSNNFLCFFSDTGLQKCKPVINEIISIIESAGGTIDELIYICEDPSIDKTVLYCDQYQAVINWED